MLPWILRRRLFIIRVIPYPLEELIESFETPDGTSDNESNKEEWAEHDEYHRLTEITKSGQAEVK